MTLMNWGTRWSAIGSAALLLVTGALVGVTVDRLWISPSVIEAAPLTAETMVSHLGLSDPEGRRLNALLDTLHADLSAAMDRGPEALREATDAAHRRIDASLPAEARADFHVWMQEHHEQMMRGLDRGPLSPGIMHQGGMDHSPATQTGGP